jgi:uncharacterized protein (UPF0276 family)
MGFKARVRALPKLGIGVSTEYGAHTLGETLDPIELREQHPAFGRFLEVGVEIAKGLDSDARRWIRDGHPWTYHFLDINLDEPEDFDTEWLSKVSALVDAHEPAWLCGDAGLWHFGPREPENMLLLPPILSEAAVRPMADGIEQLRAATAREVFPENPPGTIFLGDLHILDYFARVCEAADTGMLLDCAHLAIYQRLQGMTPTTALDGFPLDRVVELHVAGACVKSHAGREIIEDNHGTEVLPDTWKIFDFVLERAPNLKAIVFECERNSLDTTIAGFERIRDAAQRHGQFEEAPQ